MITTPYLGENNLYLENNLVNKDLVNKESIEMIPKTERVNNKGPIQAEPTDLSSEDANFQWEGPEAGHSDVENVNPQKDPAPPTEKGKLEETPVLPTEDAQLQETQAPSTGKPSGPPTKKPRRGGGKDKHPRKTKARLAKESTSSEPNKEGLIQATLKNPNERPSAGSPSQKETSFFSSESLDKGNPKGEPNSLPWGSSKEGEEEREEEGMSENQNIWGKT